MIFDHVKTFHLFIAMVIVVASSNYLVQFPIGDWLTYGAFTYPISFFVTEVTNRLYGSTVARKVVYLGFGVAVAFSIVLASPRIAIASGLAFLISQLLDIMVFSSLRQKTWWVAPFFASFAASILDTLVFWIIAFYGEDLPWVYWMCGDFGAKIALDLVMLSPFRLFARSKSQIFPIYPGYQS